MEFLNSSVFNSFSSSVFNNIEFLNLLTFVCPNTLVLQCSNMNDILNNNWFVKKKFAWCHSLITLKNLDVFILLGNIKHNLTIII